MASERLDPKHFHGKYVVDHYARYCLAAQFVSGKRVLDVACGLGYGSHFLKMAGASEVVGVDISEDAISYARQNYADPGITYVVGDAHRVNEVVQGHFDVVVSFETVEHLRTPPQFIHACRKVSHGDATLIFSVPNEAHAPPDNQFHQHFFNEDIFRDLLKDTFPEIVIKPYYMSLATAIGEPDYRHCAPLFLGDGAVGRVGAPCQQPDGYVAVCRPTPGQIRDYNLLIESRSAYEDTQQDLQWLEDQRLAWMQAAEQNIAKIAELKSKPGEVDSHQPGQPDARRATQSVRELADVRSDRAPAVSISPSAAIVEDGDGSQSERNLEIVEAKNQSWKQTAEKLAMEMAAWRRLAEQRDRTLEEQERVNRWLESENRRIEEAFSARKVVASRDEASEQNLEMMSLDLETTKQALEEAKRTIGAMEATKLWRLGRSVKAWFPAESGRGRVLRGVKRTFR